LCHYNAARQAFIEEERAETAVVNERKRLEFNRRREEAKARGEGALEFRRRVIMEKAAEVHHRQGRHFSPRYFAVKTPVDDGQYGLVFHGKATDEEEFVADGESLTADNFLPCNQSDTRE
jgi:hypothetical protein